MSPLALSQMQFAITTIYHFFFVPLTIGLAIVVAIMETLYVVKKDPMYKRMTKFWGKLFLINFAMGVVTGIVMEFQFGMNWAQYSRFVGDVFGAPLAIEALLAFFLESTFLGIWIFGWDKISKKLHLATIWLVAIGSSLSAFWILVANSFMQSPTGYQLENGRAVMTDFWALITNPYVWSQFPHTVFAGLSTATFFVLAISAYHLLRIHETELFTASMKIGAYFGVIAVLGVGLLGHSQMQELFFRQPMKVAAAEAVFETENPGSLSIFSIIDQENMREIVNIRIPYLLSILAYDSLEGEVVGLRDLQAQAEQQYGPGNYIPNIAVTYWAFRVMVGVGTLMLLIVIPLAYMAYKKKQFTKLMLFKFLPFTAILPYMGNTSGWLLTEMGRQPWVVYGVLKTEDAVSPNLTQGEILISLIGFGVIYGVLMLADIYLLAKYSKAGPDKEESLDQIPSPNY